MKAVENKDYRFRFSIVSAVYRAEEFLDEFFESILQQTIGFREHVQLILVEDGSPDASGEICDRYAALYPDNIIVIHQENGGVASARNRGLTRIEGRYVNFCDPDDKLSPDTLELVYDFFTEHEEETDIVTVPMMMFGITEGPHHLNNKFSRGTRVINLEKEYIYPHVSIGPSFLRHEVAARVCFNSALATAEDAEQITKILIDKHYIGVVAEGLYYYRRYGTSLVASAPSKKAWYSDYLRYFTLEVMNYAEQKYGYVPRFVQNTVMTDLQWKYKMQEAPEALSPEELDEYKALLRLCISKIDDEVIMRQRSLNVETKVAILVQKDGMEGLLSPATHNFYYGADWRNYHAFSRNTTFWSFLAVDDENVTVTIRQIFLNFGSEPTELYLSINGEKLAAVEQSFADHNKVIGEVISRFIIAKFVIPRSMLTENCSKISVHTVLGSLDITGENMRCDTYFPVTRMYRSAYCEMGGLIFSWKGKKLCVAKANPKLLRQMKKRYFKELRERRDAPPKKSIYARRALGLYRIFHKKPVWIISDRIGKAGDNGEAFFRYLKSICFKGAKYYYAISKGADYTKLKKELGSVVEHGSKRYKFLFLAADKIISAHAEGYVVNPFAEFSYLYQDNLRTKDFIFLQHGVTKDDISGWLNKYNKNIRGFICAAKPEYDSIIETPSYYYTEKETWLTGFARFDRLYRDEKNYISIMPTWRHNLMGVFDQNTGQWTVSASFTQSEYFLFYNALINDERLLSAAREYGYKICYMPHPNIISSIEVFDHHPEVHFFGLEDEYRDVYAHSNLILTDYSSAVFDFAYLRKPVVYTHFDSETFFQGHTYDKGYFDYERDGFGEVLYDLDSTVNTLIDYMKNGCVLKEKYRERIDNFFAFNDQNNCQRILDKILEIDEKQD